MRRGAIVLFTLILLLACAGCRSDEEARQYARNLIEVLKRYQAQIEAKAGAEKRAYKELARIYGSSAENELLAALNAERKERGDDLADQFINGKPVAGSAVKHRLQEYAEKDIEQTRELLLRDSHDREKYLTALHELSVDADSVDALIHALETLAEKPSLRDRIEFYKDYGEATKSCLDELVCNDLELRLHELKRELDAPDLTDEKRTELKAKQRAIETEQKSAGCDAKPSCPKQAKEG
jgi:uncharacterized lipoprotein YehR (DUF1307 family)